MTEPVGQPDRAEEVVGSQDSVEFQPTTAEAEPGAAHGARPGTPDAEPSPEPAGAEPPPEVEQEAPAEGETPAGAESPAAAVTSDDGDLHPDTVLAAERLTDLQRLQAEYVNYKRRVDRDRAVVQELAVHSVLESLLSVLDDIHAAREHGDLVDGPFAAIADKLESTLGKFGLERYGAAGEEFDPNLHEALMHTPWPQDGSIAPTESTTVVQVFQPGYRGGERVLRAARVAVADPE